MCLYTQVAQHAVEQYHPKHDTWVEKAPIPTARFRFGAAVVGTSVHAFGGHLLCSTGWFGDWGNTDCPDRALDSQEVLFQLDHPDVWLHVKSA